jgi:hypothetical protein
MVLTAEVFQLPIRASHCYNVSAPKSIEQIVHGGDLRNIPLRNWPVLRADLLPYRRIALLKDRRPDGGVKERGEVVLEHLYFYRGRRK